MSDEVEVNWRPSFSEEELASQSPDEQLAQAVFQALGAASMCWDDIHSAGVFRSDVAKAIGDGLLEWLRAHGEWSAISAAPQVGRG
jgi:hypothetical protein